MKNDIETSNKKKKRETEHVESKADTRAIADTRLRVIIGIIIIYTITEVTTLSAIIEPHI